MPLLDELKVPVTAIEAAEFTLICSQVFTDKPYMILRRIMWELTALRNENQALRDEVSRSRSREEVKSLLLREE